MEDRLKAFLVFFISAIIAVLVAIFISGVVSAILVIVLTLGVALITRSIWHSKTHGQTKVRLASLAIVFTISTYYLLSNPPAVAAVNALLTYVGAFSGHMLPTLNIPSPPPYVLPLALLAIVAINYFNYDPTVMQQHSRPLKQDFPEPEYIEELNNFRRLWQNRLDAIDTETNWSHFDFVPLEAEVEVDSRRGKMRRVEDLITALRRERRTSKAILVLGEPGSGKSVALRNLCRELLTEVYKTGKFPLYVNLKNWRPAQPWGEMNRPRTEELIDYIKTFLKQEADDVFGHRFIDRYFEKMLRAGRFFFLFDSFDEIPDVMDAQEGAAIIDDLSRVIVNLIKGSHDSRGILASRYQKQPTQLFIRDATYKIRPFDDSKIADTLTRIARLSAKDLQNIFRNHDDVISLCKNPLAAGLVAAYVADNSGRLPTNQTELFGNYIEGRLRTPQVAARMAELEVDEKHVLISSAAIASYMFKKPEIGLDVSEAELARDINIDALPKVIDVLRFARLARVSAAPNRRFSFVHRRFNEYFVVQALLASNEKPRLSDIMVNGRYRDALILYSQVVDYDKATYIADACWSEVFSVNLLEEQVGSPSYVRAINALRFLGEAFRNRPEVCGSFVEDLGQTTMRLMDAMRDPIGAKYAVEVAAILDPLQRVTLIRQALDFPSMLVREAAVRACRYIPGVDPALSTLALVHVFKFRHLIPFGGFLLQRRKGLLFAFQLAESFQEKITILRLAIFDAVYTRAITAFAIIISPLLAMSITTVELLGSNFAPMKIYRKRKEPSAADQQNLFRPFIFLFGMFYVRLLIVLPLIVLVFMRSNMMTDFDELEVVFPLLSFDSMTVLKQAAIVYSDTLITAVAIMYLAGSILLLSGIIWAFRAKIIEILFNLVTGGWRFWLSGAATVVLGTLFPALVSGALFAFLWFIVWLSGYLIPQWIIDAVRKALTVVGGYIIIVAAVLFVIYFTRRYYRDWRHLRKWQRRGNVDREVIEDYFGKFHTSWGRARFVRELDLRGIVATGQWRGGVVPGRLGDEGSDELARLEVRWLRLEH